MLIKREYITKSLTKDGLTISYFFSKGTSNKLIFAFPQGFREARHLIDIFPIFDSYWNIIAVDPLGRGKSTKSNNQEDYITSFQIYLDIIKEEGFDYKDTILMGKSFSSPYVEYLLRLNDNFLHSIIITGPRILSRIEYIFAIVNTKLATHSRVFRYYANNIIAFYAKVSRVDMRYYDWKEKSGWLQWKVPFLIRNHPIEPQINTPTLLIYNRRDELIPKKKVYESEKIFKNAEVYFLHSTTHWGPITKELLELLHQKLKELEIKSE